MAEGKLLGSIELAMGRVDIDPDGQWDAHS